MKKKISFFFLTAGFTLFANAQLRWINVDSLYQPLPSSVHIYFTDQAIDTAVFRAYYLNADLKDKKLDFTVDTTLNRRLIPEKFYERNGKPLVVVNCTFFSFETNRNLNLVIKDGKIIGYDGHVRPLKGTDTMLYAKYLASAIGISKKRQPDVTWIYDDSLTYFPIAFELNPMLNKDSSPLVSKFYFAPALHHYPRVEKGRGIKDKWKMRTAVGGGPVLLYNSNIRITNNEELKFAGKAINDKHPRTAMGYTKDGKLIILMIEGRNNVAHGATLGQEAEILKELGCVEGLNLDGGGSSCMLVNGKETIKPSDAAGERAVPAVFIIKQR